jgi:hypothetical protein
MNIGKTLNFTVWVALLGLLGFVFYNLYERQQIERRLREEIANLTAEERHAKIIVDAIADDGQGAPWISLRWAETDKDGRGLPNVPPKDYRVRGRELYVDSYQIIFDPAAVREGDPLKGKALTLFKSIYGDDQKPNEGLSLDVPAAVVKGEGAPRGAGKPDLVPPFFRRRDGRSAEFEKRIWSRFWDMALDAEYAKSEGVRTVQGTAVHRPVVAGKEYRLTLTAPGQVLFEGPFDPDPFARPPEK